MFAALISSLAPQIRNEYGLHLAAGVMHSWIHGGSPLHALATPSLIQEIRKKIGEGPFFQDLVKKYFLENKHRVTLTMVAGNDNALLSFDTMCR